VAYSKQEAVRSVAYITGSVLDVSAQSADKWSMTKPQRRKVTIVGDDWCGKVSALVSSIVVYPKKLWQTALVHILAQGGPLPEDLPAVTYSNTASVCLPSSSANPDPEKIQVELVLCDTTQSKQDRLGPLEYPEAHVVLICFSLIPPQTLDRVEERASSFSGSVGDEKKSLTDWCARSGSQKLSTSTLEYLSCLLDVRSSCEAIRRWYLSLR
jgi:GTPase SAR1 family protein